MTIEEYDIALENLTPPDGLDSFERRDWFQKERQKLQNQLSEDDLKVVLEEERIWYEKMQSSVG